MGKPIFFLSAFAAICTLSLCSAASVSSAPPVDCSNAAMDMVDCLSYLTNESPTPTKACCAGLDGIVTRTPGCICDALQQAADLGIALNTTLVLALPAACSIKAPVIQCNGSSAVSVSNVGAATEVVVSSTIALADFLVSESVASSVTGGS
ncbi:non-specific lipid-transfer protein-like protein [Canna indica]|uniref:Non-specific lipid-transfer protein-like protein n=1 Tax=Canna indica TaxID=4628 RepID=A0AAQ3QAN0_9LILI|nr:non-specific lipid-transfer protein-like protein [Canna indica]